MYRRRACTQVLFLCKAELGFFHFLEIVTGWLVPSALLEKPSTAWVGLLLENPSTASVAPSAAEGPAYFNQVSSGR
jgi:hypothetical protein